MQEGGGTIDREELRQMCVDLRLTPDITAKLLAQLDLDDDGEWSFYEFLQVPASLNRRAPPRPPSLNRQNQPPPAQLMGMALMMRRALHLLATAPQ
jgi:hypothetical protein